MFDLKNPAIHTHDQDTRAASHPESYAAIVKRLFAEYSPSIPLARIADTVAGCRRDLAGAPAGALPELIERLARVRLQQTSTPAA